MTDAEIAEFKRTLARYVPAGSEHPLFDFMDRNRVRLHITRQRKSKLGDYRWPQPCHPGHEISVNGNLNPYFFLMVLLHEMAHLNNFQRHGSDVQPHGREWQEEYGALLTEYLGYFPQELAAMIGEYASRLPLSHSLERRIELRLKQYDAGASATPVLILDELQPGDRFCLAQAPERRFKAVAKRRTRWVCIGLDDGRQYLVQGTAEVISD